jgi:hypothetical protein
MNLWILQFAFLSGMLMYGGVGLLVLGRRSAPPESISNVLSATSPADSGFGSTLGMIFLAMGVLMISLAFLLPRFVAGLDPERATTADQYLDSCFKQLVITNALLEAPSLFGLMALMFGQPMSMVLVVMGLSAGGMMLMIPRIRGWIDEYERRLVREG